MIKSIQFGQGVFRLAVALPRSTASDECKRSIELDFGKSGTVSELHRSDLVNFLYPVYPEGAHQIGYLIVELLGTHSRVRRVHLDCFYCTSEPLEDGATPNVGVEFASGAVESASSEEDIPF
jgi:hypothetical protein